MDAVMFTIHSPDGKPTLAEAAQRLRVQETDLDRQFGVVLIDPTRNDYTVLCRPSACRPDAPSDPTVQGPYSSPGISGFGPPR